MTLSKAVQVIGLTTLCVISLAFAEQKPAALGSSDIAPPEANEITFPYIGEVTGSQLNVRSGPGMNFYSCGKINSPLRVIVAEQKFTWVRILPPPGSFSWIFKQYIQTDANKPDVGIVTGDNVRVYAGSEDLEPMRSDSIQITLTKGQKVRIIGKAVGDYYKIAPPEGASLWTSSQYIKFIRSAEQMDLKLPAQTDVNKPAATTIEQAPTEPQTEQTPAPKPVVVIEQVELKNRNIEIYYELEKQFQDEREKSLDAQNYSNIKAGLGKLIVDANNSSAGEYAAYLLKDVERCELAIQTSQDLQKHNDDLNKRLIEIEKKHQEKLKKRSNTSKYAIIGTLKHSLVYETQPMTTRFIVSDANGIPVCFAEPIGETATLNFAPYLGKKVGLIGKIGNDKKSSLALIKFSQIELLTVEQPKIAEPNEPNQPAQPSAAAEPNQPLTNESDN
ncbi:MAG TPA: hypothetical protein DDW84_03320 [Phycisphaerales bacterium]|nr:MAG: hypothetical protein A2Y13_06935 [Planctomycetes bacterium GWC2_45_44]HBG77869.1 hypothetical protein [Phycisphaerales bacterium]HBR18654.1 hypothetical protein [Phycisphaerales bacterium]